MESYRAVIAADPGFVLAHAGMGTALLGLNRRAEAIASLERALALRPQPPLARALLLLMGEAAQALGRGADAERYFERAAAVHPPGGD